jgi:hypothetical protein
VEKFRSLLFFLSSMQDESAIDLDPAIFGPDSPCFGCSPDHPVGFRLRFRHEGGDVTTTLVPSDRLQGPPGVMHGGLVMTLADEIAAWTVIGLRERFGFTAAVQGKLHRPVRIGAFVVLDEQGAERLLGGPLPDAWKRFARGRS